jgi:hypothetical protein
MEEDKRRKKYSNRKRSECFKLKTTINFIFLCSIQIHGKITANKIFSF